MPNLDEIRVCTLNPGDEKIAEACPACGFGRGTGHNQRRPIARDMFNVPITDALGRPVFDPRS